MVSGYKVVTHRACALYQAGHDMDHIKVGDLEYEIMYILHLIF